jgi:hypothetical protein
LAVVVAGLVTDPGTALSQPPGSTPCQATSWWPWGADCYTWCPPGTACKAEGGFFSASCECVPIPAPPPTPNRYTIIFLTPIQLNCAHQLKMYLFSLGTPEANQMASAINFVINGILSGDNNIYSDAENHWADVYASTPPYLQELMANWRLAHPECNMD